MTTEYWLQKKTVGGWSHVTYYSDELEARTNLDKVAIPNNGYSWRLVKAEVIEERMLEEVVEVTKPSLEANEIAKAALWGKSVQDASNGWGASNTGWNDKVEKQSHGLAGKVWMINRSTQTKTRVDPSQVAEFETRGFVRGGPRSR